MHSWVASGCYADRQLAASQSASTSRGPALGSDLAALNSVRATIAIEALLSSQPGRQYYIGDSFLTTLTFWHTLLGQVRRHTLLWLAVHTSRLPLPVQFQGSNMHERVEGERSTPLLVRLLLLTHALDRIRHEQQDAADNMCRVQAPVIWVKASKHPTPGCCDRALRFEGNLRPVTGWAIYLQNDLARIVRRCWKHGCGTCVVGAAWGRPPRFVNNQSLLLKDCKRARKAYKDSSPSLQH
jgi:hypothetical protein